MPPESAWSAIFQNYGILGLVLVCGFSLIGATIGQIVMLVKFTGQTSAIINNQTRIVGLQEKQSMLCSMHSELVKDQVSSMKAVTYELSRLVESIHQSDQTRSHDLMEIIRQVSMRGSA